MLLFLLYSVVNGEEACEGHGFTKEVCQSTGCCEWDDGQCWSAVGRNPCKGEGEEQLKIIMSNLGAKNFTFINYLIASTRTIVVQLTVEQITSELIE